MAEILSSNRLGLEDTSRDFPGVTVIAAEGVGGLECGKVWAPSDGCGEGDRDGGVDGGARVSGVSEILLHQLRLDGSTPQERTQISGNMFVE